MKNICILTFEGNPIAAELFSRLNGECAVSVFYTKDSNLSFRQIWTRKDGLRWFWYNKLFSHAARKYGVGHWPQSSWSQLRDQFPELFVEVDNHNSIHNQENLRKWKIDLGILIGTPLIKSEVFNIPKYGMINLHQGHIPRYRGTPPAFWEHYNKEPEMHVTVHSIIEKLDAGPILEERKFPIHYHKHFVVSKFYANMLSANMLKDAVNKAFKGIPGESREVRVKPNTVPRYSILFRETLKLWRI